MTFLKKTGLLFILVSIAALDIFFYWNGWFYGQAKKQNDDERKIVYLERSNRFCPLNDLVFYELGKAHLDLGMKSLGDPAEAGDHFRKAAQSLERSIMINPCSPYAHFYLAQALLQLDFFSPANDSRFSEEYKKAAQLAGEDSQVYGEVGRIFFSRWQKLSEDDRRFTLDLLRKIMAGKDRDQITTLLSIWEMNVGDTGVMDSILPADAEIYRIYAGFIGEKSLSLSERHKVLAQAEFLEFERARRELQAGEYALYRYQVAEARDRLNQALNLLEGIRFYQMLLAQNMIAHTDYHELLRAVRLDLAKCRIEEGGKLEDVVDDLSRYLALEDRPNEVSALETYLKGKGILEDQPGAGFDDLSRLAFEILLQFKQTRYRDIISLGRTLQKSLVIVPEAKQKDYARVLRLVGDSFQKVDFLYDAGDTYRRALELEPQSLEILLRLCENYVRLNDEKRLRGIDEAIGKIETPRAIDLSGLTVPKGRAYSRALTFRGGKIALDLYLNINQPFAAPIVSVFFNNRVVWEDTLAKDTISLSLETKPGINILQVIPLNRAISLAKITWEPANNGPRQ
jgi:hypothetical protein